MMPFLAILGHELRSLWSSWLVRLWLAGTALLTFLLVASNWGQMPSSVLIAFVLLPYLIFPWCLIVMILGISPVTGSRLDALADGILSRPVTRHEYLLASWSARVAVVLTVYLAVLIPTMLILTLAKRPVADDGVTLYGTLIALTVVGVVLTFLVSLAFLVGTVLRHPMLAAVVLVFLWFPVNLVLHTFSLEELSPISLTQALPTVLKTPWRHTDGAAAVTSQKDIDKLTRQAANFLSALSTGSAPENQSQPKFFEDGDYEDFSVFRVLCGYGLPALFAVGLAVLVFHRRDL
jgi:hypothetical protein